MFEEEQRIVEEDGALLEKAANIKKQIERDLQSAYGQLEDLQKQLPDILARHTLGQVSDEDLADTRREIATLRERIADAPLILKGLRPIQHQLMGRVKASRNVLREYREYEDVKEQLRHLAGKDYMKIPERKAYKAME